MRLDLCPQSALEQNRNYYTVVLPFFLSLTSLFWSLRVLQFLENSGFSAYPKNVYLLHNYFVIKYLPLNIVYLVILDTSNQYENTGEALMTAEDLNQRLIWVYLDANKISEEKLSGILCDLVWPVLDSDLVQGDLSRDIDNKTFRR